MLLSAEVLQLSATELAGWLQREAEENEALRFEDVTPGPPRGAHLAPAPGGEEALDWIETTADRGRTLDERALEQVPLLDLEPRLEAWVRLVIQALDEHGYLSLSDEDLLGIARAQALDGGAAELGRAIAVVQSLEPRGIGGRDLIEALLLQLDPRDPDYGLLCRLLEEFLGEVVKNKLKDVARGLGIDLERLRELLLRLHELELAPAAQCPAASLPPLVPDLVVERVGHGFEVRLTAASHAPVALDPRVRALARDKRQSLEIRRWLRAKIERARWLLEALALRERTLLDVATAAFRAQHAFLEHGDDALVPLSMAEVAEELGVAPSTVSRCVAGKHAATPFGVRALRIFFQSPAGGSADVSLAQAQAAARAIVAAEDPRQPLSDDAIARHLRARGLVLARRTVAKHRVDLGIPSSYRRRHV
jgi:RNA polymerase sigma-54 factor